MPALPKLCRVLTMAVDDWFCQRFVSSCSYSPKVEVAERMQSDLNIECFLFIILFLNAERQQRSSSDLCCQFFD
jgi:hypothetical protein